MLESSGSTTPPTSRPLVTPSSALAASSGGLTEEVDLSVGSKAKAKDILAQLLGGLKQGLDSRTIELDPTQLALYEFYSKNEGELLKFLSQVKQVYKGNVAEEAFAAELPGLLKGILGNIQKDYSAGNVRSVEDFFSTLIGDSDGVGAVADLIEHPEGILKDPLKTQALLTGLVGHIKTIDIKAGGQLLGDAFLGNTDQITGLIDRLAQESPYLNKLWRLGSYVLVALTSIAIVAIGIIIKDSKDKALGIVGSIGGAVVLDALLAIIDAIIYKRTIAEEAKARILQEVFEETAPARARFAAEAVDIV